MRPDCLPTRLPLAIIGALAALMLAALLAGVPTEPLTAVAVALVLLVAGAMLADYWWTSRTWERAPPELQRHMPVAMAIGARCSVTLRFQNQGPRAWVIEHQDVPGAWALVLELQGHAAARADGHGHGHVPAQLRRRAIPGPAGPHVVGQHGSRQQHQQRAGRRGEHHGGDCLLYTSPSPRDS